MFANTDETPEETERRLRLDDVLAARYRIYEQALERDDLDTVEGYERHCALFNIQ